jgi:hypothetical protein
MPKRVLKEIRLDRIAAVDRPCQQHATVAIIKRAPDPQAIAKATFAEALSANMTADAVNDAFFDSFDGLWQRNDAFKTALTDELAAGGDGSVASDAYKASVSALVDDAVSRARQAGANPDKTDDIDKALKAAVESWLEARNPKEPTIMKITDRASLQAAVSKFAIATSTVQEAEDIRKAATDLNAEDLLPAEGPLAKAKPDPELAKAMREIAILKLSPDARKHFDGLDETAQTAFLAKSADEQAAEIEKANGDDPVIYKCLDGTEIRKSDGAFAAKMAKRADDQETEIAKLRGQGSAATIEKRAVEEFPNVAKGTAVAMLTSIEKLGADSEAGKDVLKSLTTMQNSGKRLFKTLGSDEDNGDQGGSEAAVAKFDGKVAEIAKRDNIDKAAAMSKARVEHEDLFKEAYPETVQAVEDRTLDVQMAR